MTNSGTQHESPSPQPSAFKAWMIAWGNFFFRHRNALFPVVFVLLLVFTRPAHFLGHAAWDRYAIAAGILIALLGQGIRMFVIGYAYIVRGGKNRQVYADDLVIAGVYAHSRNPMYVGNLLMALGLGMVYGSPWIYILVIPFFTFVYVSIVFAEEAYLRKKFQRQYDDYMNAVPRFWFRFEGLRDTLAGQPYDWRKVLAKEYGTMFGTFSGLIGLLIAKYWWMHGSAAARTEITVLSYMCIPLVVFYFTVKWLKKTGRLSASSAAKLHGE